MATDDQTKHDLVSKLKDLAIELKRAPTYQEFLDKTGTSHYAVQKFYRNFTLLSNAAGIVPYQERRKMPPNEVLFRADLEETLKNHIPERIIPGPALPRILICGDYHAPFHSKYAVAKVIEFAKNFKPEYVIQMGDAYDFLAHSKFPRSHNYYNAKQEEELGRAELERFWREIQAAAPKAKCIQIVGNHDLRPLKRILEVAPNFEHWAQEKWKQLMTFEGVETYYDHREEVEIAGILFTHGFLHSEGRHRDYFLQNVVIGHLHKLWVQYRKLRGQSIWELSCGFLGDPESKALGYTPSKKANMQLGFAAIDEFGPRLIHL